MMRVPFGSVALALLLGATAPIVHASALDFIPASTARYSDSGAAAREVLDRAWRTDGERARAVAFASQPTVASAEPQSYWPILYSALVPGLGELSMGYRLRGAALMLVEAAAWTGYIVKHGDGLDRRDEYERFADEHWDMSKWIDDHPCPTLPPSGRTLEDVEECGRASSGSGGWPGYIPWVSKEEDRQHYYENIGKYDWYISGWEDFDASLDPYPRETDRRDQYRAMRQESNDALDAANYFVIGSIVVRVVSLAQTAILVHQRRGAAESEVGSALMLRARPRGFSGGEVALEFQFK